VKSNLISHRQIQPNNEALRMNIKIQNSFANSIKLDSKNIRVISERDLESCVLIAHWINDFVNYSSLIMEEDPVQPDVHFMAVVN
jgi:hypothetical protein